MEDENEEKPGIDKEKVYKVPCKYYTDPYTGLTTLKLQNCTYTLTILD